MRAKVLFKLLEMRLFVRSRLPSTRQNRLSISLYRLVLFPFRFPLDSNLAPAPEPIPEQQNVPP
jgi:hypothetical protein